METHRISLTSSALAHGRLNLRSCGREFFPADCFGKPAKSDGTGTPVRLSIDGFDEIIESDLPTDRAGRPRWFFRARGWVNALHQLLSSLRLEVRNARVF